MEDSVSDVIAILKEQANRMSLSSGGDSDEDDDAREYMESDG